MMGKEHIDFSRLEPGSPLDEEHLRTCGECRQKMQLLEFVRDQLRSSPLEVPPFFSSRVARLAHSLRQPRRELDFYLILEQMARRAVAAAGGLLLLTFLALQAAPEGETSPDQLAGLLLQEPTVDRLSVDSVLDLLSSENLEENGEGYH